MADWQDTPLSVLFDEMRPILVGIQTFANVTAAILDPLVEVLDAAAAVLAAIDPDAFAIDFLLNLLAQVDIVHLYPSQTYQALQYSQWSEAAAYSLGAGVGAPDVSLCTTPPYSLLGVVVTADAPARMIELATDLRSFFGYTGTLFDDIPLELDRTRFFLQRANCVRIDDEIPILGEVTEYLQAQVTLSAASTVAALQSALVTRIEDLSRQVKEIQSLINVIDGLDVPDVKTISISGIINRDDILPALAAAGGIGGSTFVAGTVMVTDLVGSLALAPLLGLPSFEDFKAAGFA